MLGGGVEPPAGFEPATTGSPGGDFGLAPGAPYEAGALPLSYGGSPGLRVAWLGFIVVTSSRVLPGSSLLVLPPSPRGLLS